MNTYLLIIILLFAFHFFHSSFFQRVERFYLSCVNTTKQVIPVPSRGEIHVIETKCPNSKQTIYTNELRLLPSQLTFTPTQITTSFANNTAEIKLTIPSQIVVDDNNTTYQIGKNIKTPLIPSTFNSTSKTYQISWNHIPLNVKSSSQFQIVSQDTTQISYVCKLEFVDSDNFKLFSILPQNNQFI